MKKLQRVSDYSDDELKNILSSQTEVRAFRDWQIIYSVQTNPGSKAEEIARILGIKKSKVLRVIQLYNKSGINWRVYGHREQRCHLSIKEEAALLSSIEEEALSGRILTYKQIKKKVETEAGKEVSDDYIWDLFSRHNRKKKVLRQSHPKAGRQAREEYKKTSGKIRQPDQQSLTITKIQGR